MLPPAAPSRSRFAAMRARLAARHLRRELILGIILATLLVIGAFVVALRFVQPAPPRTIVISTGSPESGYHRTAQRYKQILSGDGVQLEAERVPLYDILEMVAYAKQRGVRLLGPGCIGVLSPGIAAAGWLGGNPEYARRVFLPGPVGVMSRSGGQSGTVPWAVKEVGLGVSTVVHIGTEPVLGTSFGDILPLFEKDPDTKGVAVFGEIGGPYEEEAAECVRKKEFTKPLVIFVAGAWAPEGMRFSHASSIIEQREGFGEEQDSNPEGSRCACGGSAR